MKKQDHDAGALSPEWGQIVTSRAGRDVTRAYMVTGVEGDRLLLADGGKRTLGAPKRKNIRHITRTNAFVPTQDRDNDANIKSALAAYMSVREAGQQGG